MRKQFETIVELQPNEELENSELMAGEYDLGPRGPQQPN